MIRKSTLKLAVLIGLSMVVTGCNAQSKRDEMAKSPETQARVKALVEKTLKQMKLIQAGAFWLGDFGVVMPENPKGEGKLHPLPPAGPNAKFSADNLPLTDRANNKPPKWVTLDGFYIQSHKVTYEDFDVYTVANGLPPHPSAEKDKGDETYFAIWRDARTSGDIPAGVNWYQAKGYCQWLGKVTGLPFDLPTEAQWEFAASNRENNWKHPYPTQSGLMHEGKTNPTFSEQEKMVGLHGALYPVGRYDPSPAGLYDLIWNGLDWVNDWYAADAYVHDADHNPKGPATGTEKVLRGSLPNGSPDIAFLYLDRYHENPKECWFRLNGKPTPCPFTRESFRCVINQSTSLTSK